LLRPEFLNRIDEIIMFEPLSRDDVHNIVKIQFNEIAKRLAQQHLILTATDEAIDWLAQLGYDPQYGARPVKRVMQNQLLNELSKQILADKVDRNKAIIVDVFDKLIVFRN
jgi:ATP-dependent Clp protease ATP-binding subunit ClpB